jgi:indole-3-glycerol phosphate synthase
MNPRFDLRSMRAHKLAEIPTLRDRLRRLPARTRRMHEFAPAAGRVNIIAEVKKSSPSAGLIRNVDPASQAEAYLRGGACALSVLTDGSFFGGSFDDLEAVCAVTDLPVLCKEFVYFPEQVECAHRAGADMVLLIARALTDDEMRTLYAMIAVTGMLPLVEVHRAEELMRLHALDCTVVMVNTRDLGTLMIDRDEAARTLESAPPGMVKILASGIESRADIEFFRGAGAETFLVGSTLMKSGEPDKKIRELCDVR